MNCKKCGNPIPVGEKYCNVCGAEQIESTNEQVYPSSVQMTSSVSPVLGQTSSPLTSPINQTDLNNKTNTVPNMQTIPVEPNLQSKINQPTNEILNSSSSLGPKEATEQTSVNQAQASTINTAYVVPNMQNNQVESNIQPNVAIPTNRVVNTVITPESTPQVEQPNTIESVVNTNTPVDGIEQSAPINNTPVVDQTQVTEEKTRKKNSKIGLIIIILLILGVIGYFGWQYLSLMSEANRVKSQQNNKQKEKDTALVGKVVNNGNKYILDLSNVEDNKTYKYKINDKYLIKIEFTKSKTNESYKDATVIINDTKINSGCIFDDKYLEFYVYGNSILFIDSFKQTNILGTSFDIFYLDNKEVVRLNSIKDQGNEFFINDNNKEYEWEFSNDKVNFYGIAFLPDAEVSTCDKTTWGASNITPTSTAIIKANLVMENNALSKTVNVGEKITMEEYYNKICQPQVPVTPVQPSADTTNTTSPTTNTVGSTNPITNPVE